MYRQSIDGKSMKKSFGVVLVITLFAAQATPQKPFEVASVGPEISEQVRPAPPKVETAPPAPGAPKFEVASVKPCAPGDGAGRGVSGQRGGPGGGGSVSTPPGRLF